MRAGVSGAGKASRGFLVGRLSTVRKEIAHQREDALAFGVSKHLREKLVAGQLVHFRN